MPQGNYVTARAASAKRSKRGPAEGFHLTGQLFGESAGVFGESFGASFGKQRK